MASRSGAVVGLLALVALAAWVLRHQVPAWREALAAGLLPG